MTGPAALPYRPAAGVMLPESMGRGTVAGVAASGEAADASVPR